MNCVKKPISIGDNMGRVITINGKKLEVPELELFCEKCGTTNYFYDDDKPPYHCDNCKNTLDAEKDKLSPVNKN
jgi:hypothetical protein